ncbi:hypothetical protein [Stappia indica]|uniref:Glycosyl transferases group 1 n=1 Tax=Stappia indica TaxID=538381 RepID=A0A285RQY3_9HYPH|nr:hypothetical protein [Stappia indica]SOB96168.1 hypothetical protein SAMN05421512_102126 [Stappia indica]
MILRPNLLRKAALATAFDHFTGRPKTAYPTRYHYVEICGAELSAAGLQLGRIGQHGLTLTDGHGRSLAIVVRYVTARDLRLLSAFRAKGGRIAYLLDDDLWAMASDIRLDPRYRGRIARFLSGLFPKLLELVDVTVAPNRRLLERLAPLPGAFLHPADLAPTGDLAHFEANEGQTRVLFLGTATHAEDFAAVAPGLAEALAAEPGLRVETFLGAKGEALLPASRQVAHMMPMVLEDFQRWLNRARHHIALAPYAVNPVNDGRSIIKLHQHAVAGAAGIYTPTAVFAPVIEDGRNGVFAAHEPAAFRDAVLRLARDRAKAKEIAQGGIALSRRLGDRTAVAGFWADHVAGRQPGA